MGRVFILACIFFTVFPSIQRAAALPDFIGCIGPQGVGRVCQLDSGTYSITTPLQIGRSNVTLKGTADAVLQRAPGFAGSMLVDGPGLTSITIRDLTFDGNRTQQSGAQQVYSADVQMNTTQSLLFSNVRFLNSPNVALAVVRNPAGVVINKCQFLNSAGNAIQFTADAASLVEAPDGYKLCPALSLPSNTVVANSTFTDIAGNALRIDGNDIQIVGNTLTNSGPLDVSVCAANAAVLRNTISGAQRSLNGGKGDGIQVHGISVSLIDNNVTASADNGVRLLGAQNILIANWNSATAIGDNGAAGIWIENAAGWRNADFLRIDHANSINNSQGYGIEFVSTSNVPFDNVVITNNCLKGNGSGLLKTSLMGSSVVIANNAISNCGVD